LDRHPEIQSNKVVLVGESYGGTRATAILNILLNVRDYAAGNRNFYDENLFAAIDSHFRKVYPEMSADPHKEVIKQQFYATVMIQPLIAGEKQFQASGELLEIEGSPIYEVETETGVNYSPCSQYNPGCEPHNNALQYLRRQVATCIHTEGLTTGFLTIPIRAHRKWWSSIFSRSSFRTILLK
ncbi:MAG TPA: hypothetical protein P5044_12195, partial [bacterium]|nr:hypothetical protein [bacterium]